MNRYSQPVQVDNKIMMIITNANSKIQITRSNEVQISKFVTEDRIRQQNLTEKAAYELCRSHHAMDEMRQNREGVGAVSVSSTSTS
jgi:hypothetical protein